MSWTIKACLIFLLVATTASIEEPRTVEFLAAQVNELVQTNLENIKRIEKLETIIATKAARADAELEERVAHLEDLSRSKLYRSCHELSLHGITTNGTYEIDPDGEAKGDLPIEVYCDFTNNVTEVLHDFDDVKWTIPHCEEEFCSSMNLSYEAPMNQLKALIELSSSCKQEIIFDCFLAPLLFNDVNIAAWTDRWGEKQFYFDGSNYGSHVCACDKNNSCEGSDTFANKCNCDNTFEHEWKEDLGFITNKTALPITAFNYGFLIYDVMEAMVQIGRLQCSGEASYSSPANTCRDLKMGGEQKSGLFLIEDQENDNFAMISKCDMEGPDYDDVREEKFGWQKFSTGPSAVVFAVRNTAQIQGPQNSSIVFDEVIVNQGDGFDKNMFIAPVQGLYEFSFSALSTGTGGHHFTVEIILNNEIYQQMIGDNYQFTYLGKTWTLPLSKGDMVSLVLRDGEIYGESMKAEFSGKLL